MTKTEVRKYLKRIREDVRDAEVALAGGDESLVIEFLNDAGGAAAHIVGTIEDEGLR